MYDPDVIAYLFPPQRQDRDGALEAIHMFANRSRFSPPRRCNDLIDLAPETQSHFGGKATEPPEEVDDLECLPCLVLRFSHRPKSHLGLVAGRSPYADLMMPDIKGVSRYHFALTFDEQKELVVKDLGSLVGTQVIYDGEEGQQGHRVTWSARGPDLVKGKVPVLKVVESLQFRMVVPDHDITSPVYLSNVAQFLAGTAAVEDLLLELKIMHRTQTELPTTGKAHTQNPRQIFWKRELARGGFAVVTYAWDVTSRATYALKEPLSRAGGDWKQEAKIMKGISHDNIIALKHAVFDAGPQLYFEYAPEGDLSLDRYKFTTPFQRGQIATQLLDAITYLHNEKSVVHRDIKPANTLVQYWSPDRVHVKLGDFGLSKQSDDLKTFCGTQLYLAPEVFCTHLANYEKRKNDVKYDSLVDIWSLAVLLVMLECGKLPKYFGYYTYSGGVWGRVMVDFVQRYQLCHGMNKALSLLLEDMLVVDPEKRQPAKKCHDKALLLFVCLVTQISLTMSHRISNIPGRGDSGDVRMAAPHAARLCF